MIRMWEILVPAETLGKEIPIEYHKKWDDKVKEIAGGLTIFKPAIGMWVSPAGKIFKDKMIPVRISCTKYQIKKIMRMALDHYVDEETIIAYQVSNKVLLIGRD